MLDEVVHCLRPAAGEVAVDCTIGGGGHARAILEALQPGGRLIGLDVDAIELRRTEARLRAAGFAQARAWLYERPVQTDEPLAFLKTAILGEHLERLPEAERDPFAQAVLDRLGDPFIARYVRLNMEANAGA